MTENIREHNSEYYMRQQLKWLVQLCADYDNSLHVANKILAVDTEQLTENLKAGIAEMVEKMPFSEAIADTQKALWKHNAKAIGKIIDLLNIIRDQILKPNDNSEMLIASLIPKVSAALAELQTYIFWIETYDPHCSQCTVADLSSFIQEAYKTEAVVTGQLQIKTPEMLKAVKNTCMDLGMPVEDYFQGIKEIIYNAFKYGATNVEVVTTIIQNSMLVVRVSDNGKGMDDKRLALVQSAVNDDPTVILTPDDRAESTGLGLGSIAKLGIDLDIISTLGKGTKVIASRQFTSAVEA